MKRAGLFALLMAVALFCVGDAFGGGKGSYCGRPKVWIEISPPEQETYVQGEETHFNIYVQSNRPDWWLKRYLKDAQMEGSFPDTEAAVELEKVSNVEYAFDTGSLSKVGTNTLSVTLCKVNLHLIDSLENIKACLEAKIDYYRGLLEGDTPPHLRKLLEKLVGLYERIIGRIEDRIAAVNKRPIASAEVSFEVTADTTPPEMVHVYPPNESLDAPIFTDIVWEFSEPLAPETVNFNTVRVTVLDITGETWIPIPVQGELRLENDGRKIVFAPVEDLALGTIIQWTLSSVDIGDDVFVLSKSIEIIPFPSQITDLYGNALVGKTACWFQTGTTATAWVDPNRAAVSAKYDYADKKTGKKNWVVSPQMNELNLNAHLIPKLKGDEKATCKWEKKTGDLQFKSFKDKKAKWADSYTQTGKAKDFAMGVAKDDKTLTTVSEAYVRVKKPEKKDLPKGKFVGKMSFQKGIKGVTEVFNIYSLEAKIVLLKAEEKSFNRFDLTLGIEVKHVPEPVEAGKATLVNCQWKDKDGKPIVGQTAATCQLRNTQLPLEVAFEGKYSSGEMDNKEPCLFHCKDTVGCDNAWEILASRLRIRPTRDDITDDYGDGTGDQVIRVYIKDPESQYPRREPDSWGKTRWKYQEKDQIVHIEVQAETLLEGEQPQYGPLRDTEIYLRVVDPPDYAPYAKAGWWLGNADYNDNGDNDRHSGRDPVINYDKDWDKRDYPLGTFEVWEGNKEKKVRKGIKVIEWEPRKKKQNAVYIRMKTDNEGKVKIDLRITDHLGGDNYYVIASFYPIKLPAKFNYRSLTRGKQRTGCLTAWKRLLYHNYGMKGDPNDPEEKDKEYWLNNKKKIAKYFKPAYVEMVPVKKSALDYVAKLPNDLHTWVRNNLGAVAAVNTCRYCFAFDVQGRGETESGICVTPLPKTAFTWYGYIKTIEVPPNPADSNTAEFHAFHELIHCFQQESDPNIMKGAEVPAVRKHYQFDKFGHDPATRNGIDGKPATMRASNGQTGLCLKHLEALRRQRYDFFQKWFQERDKKK